LAQELLCIGRSDGVVPLWEGCVSGDPEIPQPLGRRFDLEWVVLRVQVRADSESRGSGGLADQAEDLVVVGERLGSPVLADLTEQAAFNRDVLGGAGGIVSHGDGESQSITEVLLELVLPSATRGGIAAAGVGQDQQVLGVWVAPSSFLTPPTADGSDGESGGLVTDADEHRTAVGLGIINAEGEGDARSEGAKVVVVNRRGDALPLPTGILEVAYQFPLLGIDTDDGIAVTTESTSQSGNVAELLVACRAVPSGDLFTVHAEREMQFVEQSGDGACADPDAQPLELPGDLGRGLVRPPQAAHRIAGRIVFQQPLDLRDYLGRFFSTGLRPPPCLRTRSHSTSCASSSFRPRATVCGSSWSNSASL